MIRYLFAGLLWGSLVPSLLVAGSAGPTDGLWHAFEKENRKSVFFLVVSDNQVDVYSPRWIPFDLDVELGDQITFRLPVGVDGIGIEGSFENGRFQGKWHRPHPQFRIEGEWFAERIIAASDYDPWEYLRSDKDIASALDLVSLVADRAPVEESFESFKKLWNEEIEARYYPLLASTLYSDATGEFRIHLRDERVQEIYSYLRSRSASLRKALEQLPDQLDGVRKDLQDKFSWVTFLHRPVFMLTGSKLDFATVMLPVDGEARSFLLIGADWLEGQTREEQKRYSLARALLYQMVAVPQPRLGAEIARRGIAIWAAEQLEYSGRPEDFIFLSSSQWDQLEESLPDLCRRLRGVYFAPLGDQLENYFLRGSRPGYVIGYAFARAMSEGLQPEQMFTLESHQLEQRFQAFMSLKAAEGRVASGKN
ncbi:MAG TPA: hypothetical protein VKZ59_16195 [Acidobacteriota bacterium]|nr:hypothetical protein [Acidobacteriota bacterium]